MCLTLLVIMFVVMLVVIVILLMIWLPSILALGILSGLGRFGFALRLARTIGPAEEIAHDSLHPLRKGGKALAQVIADGGTVSRILQHRDETRADSIHDVTEQQVTQPREPEQRAWRDVPRAHPRLSGRNRRADPPCGPICSRALSPLATTAATASSASFSTHSTFNLRFAIAV